MITLSQPRAGVIEIDFSQESTFDVSSHGLDITYGLNTKSIKQGSIVVDDGGDPGSVLRYLIEALRDTGFQSQMEAALGISFQALKEESGRIQQIRTGKIVPIPFRNASAIGIKRTLLDHQIRAVKHGLKAYHPANFSVPGSGKTTVALSIFAALRAAARVRKIIVVGPASCFNPWIEEYKEVFGHEAQVMRLIGTRIDRRNWSKRVADVEMILCTYQMAYREADNIVRVLKGNECLLVLDESHYVKNMQGAWATRILEFAPFAKHRMILTGTPAPRSLKDFWTQFTFLWPSQALVGSKTYFEKVSNSASANANVRRMIQPFFVRTTKADLGLPRPVTISDKILYSEIPKRQRTIIQLLEAKTLAQIKTLKPALRDFALIKKWRKARVLRLMQASSNPMLLSTALPDFEDVDDVTRDDPILEKAIATYGKTETPAKIEYVVHKTRELVKSGKKVLIWATFIYNLRVLKKLLSDLGAEMIYGDVPAYMEDEDSTFPSRERIIRDFKDPKSSVRVLIANPAACAESISLHMVCHDAIYLERTFNCGQFLQSLDRIHRVGLKKTAKISYYVPLIDTAIERVIDARLSARQRTLYAVLDDPAPIVSGLDEDWLIERDEELEDIFRELAKELLRDAKKHPSSP